MTRIAFRVDASATLGAGHVARCATLAGHLRERGAEIRFLCRELPGHFCDWLAGQGYAVTRLPGGEWTAEADAAASSAALAAEGPLDWLVVDHYGLDARWQRLLRLHARRLMVIDDLADRPHACDLLLDQNFRPGPPLSYATLAPGAQLLLGPRYALLRPEFAVARAKLEARSGSVRHILICFGGADPHNHTAAALAALAPRAATLARIDVVLGAANPHRQSIAALCASLPQARLHCPADDMAGLMAAADLAIGAGGTMNWERACLALPTLAFAIADNQAPGLTALLAAGVLLGQATVTPPDAAAIGAWLDCLLDNPPLLQGLAERSSALVDGRGADRVADLLLPPALSLRPASAADGDRILAWRNHPAVRAVSLDDRPIDTAAHYAWLARTLADPARSLLIAEAAGTPVGVVRFDYAGDTATISVYRAPEAGSAGRGLIRAATAWLRAQSRGIRRIRAEVLPANLPSLAAFRAAGYRDSKNVLEFVLDTP